MNRFLLQLLCAALFFTASSAPLLAAEESTPAPLSASPQYSLLPALPVTPPAPSSATTGVRLGLVDIKRISTESALGKATQAQIKAQQAKLQKQVDTKRHQLDKLKNDIERQLPTLTPAQREAKAKEFQKKVEAFQKFGINTEKEFMETQEKLTKELLTGIEQAANAIGKLKGLSAVVVKRELLYLGSGVEAVDISEEVSQLVDATNSTN